MFCQDQTMINKHFCLQENRSVGTMVELREENLSDRKNKHDSCSPASPSLVIV